jgi:hypothetical protein
MTGRDMMGFVLWNKVGHGIKVCYREVRELDRLIKKITTNCIVSAVNERITVKKRFSCEYILPRNP